MTGIYQKQERKEKALNPEVKKDQHHLEYSGGYGEEYQVWISYLPNSMTAGRRVKSLLVKKPVFYKTKRYI